MGDRSGRDGWRAHSTVLALAVAVAVAVAASDGAAMETPTRWTPGTGQVGAALEEALMPEASEAGSVVQGASVGAIEKARLVLEQHRALVVAMAIPFGVLLTVAGFWVLSPAMFCAAFAAGGFVGYVAVYSLTKNTAAVTWASAAALLVGGVLLGVLSLYLVPLGVFALGATMGVVFALALNAVLVAIREDQPAWALYVLAGSFGVVFGALALQVQHTLLVVATAFSGSFMTLSGVGFFVGHFPRFSGMEREVLMRDPLALLYFGAYLLMGVLGCIIQFRLRSRWRKKSWSSRERYEFVDDEDDDDSFLGSYA
mmetsp:Transcript_3858/g.10622  ORF Transcript_3858/g.10622 Transcript_3858/m.10622 type:complete len:313 (-) Transcript_3858:745-1683(-)